MRKTVDIYVQEKMDMDVELEKKTLRITGVVKNYSEERLRITFDILFSTPSFNFENTFSVSVNLNPQERKKYYSSQITVPGFFKEAFKESGTKFQLDKGNISVTFLD